MQLRHFCFAFTRGICTIVVCISMVLFKTCFLPLVPLPWRVIENLQSCTVYSKYYATIFHLKAPSVIVNSKLHFFPNPQKSLHLCIIRENFTVINYVIQQFSRKQHIFATRDNSLLLGIDFRRRKFIQGSISSNKLFKSLFSQVLVFSMWHGNIMLTFLR